MTEPKQCVSFSTFQDPDDFKRLRDIFDTAGYNNTGVLETLGIKDLRSIRGNDVPVLLHRTINGTPLDTFIRLFLIEAPCDAASVQQAIKPMNLEKLIESGLIRVDGTLVKAAVKLLPYNDLLLAFDLPGMLQSDLKQHYVMGIGRSTITLANLTVRRKARMALDLGAGCGIHALLASQHSERVYAADLNPRAVQLASFNAQLNGLSNIKCAEGDLFKPVQGQKFDLVVTNPPFVISPEKRYIYRDSDMEADSVCKRIVRQAPKFLNDGGYCQILCNWVEKSGQDWQERLRDWFDGTGCDVWVMRSETRDAETYASTWIQHTEKDEADRFTERFEKWMDYYKDHGIDSVSAGLITMRRSTREVNRFRADDGPEKMLGPCGDYIMRVFELQDFLATINDDSMLLNTCFKVSPDIRLERLAMPSDRGWVDEKVQLRLTRGLAYSGKIDPYMANMIVGCNGKSQLKELLAEMANSLSVDLDKIVPTFCNVVRGLIERGFLLPIEFEKYSH